MLQVLQCFQKNKIKCFKYFSTFKTYLIIDFSMRVHYTHFQNIDLWAFYAVSAVHKSSESRIFIIIVLNAGFVIVCPKCSLFFVLLIFPLNLRKKQILPPTTTQYGEMKVLRMCRKLNCGGKCVNRFWPYCGFATFCSWTTMY